MKFRLFQSQSFAPERLNRLGEADSQGVSDAELGDKIAQWFSELSNGRIEVVRTRNPYDHYLSEAVRRDICSSDGVLCVFTKRTKDNLKNKWLPSTYVISEGSAALMQFPSEEETHRRLFGLVEDGIDHEQLGMAFHGNKIAPRFFRDNEAQLKTYVKEIVDQILDQRTPVPHRENWEYVSIDKVASVWRNGAVLVETRHRFRFTAEVPHVRIPHIMWRVSGKLPPLEKLIASRRDSAIGFLRVMPIYCGRHDPYRCRCVIRPGGPSQWDYERNFFVEFPDLRMHPGEELEYEVVWAYPHAFHNAPASGAEDKPNSVGLRTSGRGKAGSASLTLRFERDLEGEPFRVLEHRPQLHTTHITDLPGWRTPEDFFHKCSTWKLSTELSPCSKRSSTMSEVYHWATGPFQGMAKVIWTPHLNYFDLSDSVDQAPPVEPAQASAS